MQTIKIYFIPPVVPLLDSAPRTVLFINFSTNSNRRMPSNLLSVPPTPVPDSSPSCLADTLTLNSSNNAFCSLRLNPYIITYIYFLFPFIYFLFPFIISYSHTSISYSHSSISYSHTSISYSHSSISYSHTSIFYSHTSIFYSHSSISYLHSLFLIPIHPYLHF